MTGAPAHGHPFKDLKQRAQSIKEHHHERLDEIRADRHDLGERTSTPS